ncbi:MAG: DNA replication and repair protein RecF [Cyclobacteriaceae bacterium]|nr:DNA replication and repair protein RecF [Cyclobacteriaceae bacterium]
MRLKKISLFNFKNHSSTELSFSDGINCFIGINGSGKTNILDAIHYLSLTKSSLNSVDSQSIKLGESFFSIKGIINNSSEHEILCALQNKQKKVFKVDNKEYEKLSEHIGRFPVVLIAPNDNDVIRDSNEIRRKFFDSIISQLDSKYLLQLIRYNHFLKQRNALLKQFSQNKSFEQDLLTPYSLEIIELSKSISEFRKKFIEGFIPNFINHYQNLCEDREQVNIRYKSQTTTPDFDKLFHDNTEKDLITQRTNVGIHKDEYDFLINENTLKKFGSQGQQKSFLIALKLTQFDIITKAKGFKPILLLDDIFDKLDDLRIKKLIEMVANNNFGQLFITDARPERSKELLKDLKKNTQFFEVLDGKIISIK